MANKDYNKEDGVWRTIGGRRVFIKNGQSLADAMKESGKFKNKNASQITLTHEEYLQSLKDDATTKTELDEIDKELKEAKEKSWLTEEDANWLKEQGHEEKLNKKIENFKPSGDIEDDERRLEDISSNYFYDEVGIYNENIDSTSSKWAHDKAVELNSKKELSDKEKGLEEFTKKYNEYRNESDKLANLGENEKTKRLSKELREIESKYDLKGKDTIPIMQNYDKEIKYPRAVSSPSFESMGLDVKDKKAFSEYLQDKYGTDDFRIINFENKDDAKKIYNDFQKKQKEFKVSMGDVDIPDGFEAQFNDYVKARNEKYKATKHEGFGDYNDDYTPVYNGDIDYKGDFSRTNLSKLSDEEITKALNEQSKQWREAMNEKVGDRRTRNGRMDEIFKNAKVNKYEQGSKLLSEEIDKRGLPRYNIYDVKNKDFILVSSPTKEMAERQLQEMYETDKDLQKYYGWKELPKYEIKESKASLKETEEQMNGNNITNSLKNKAYQKYMKEHPNSKMTLAEFKKKK